ncbi:MAG: DUF523 domain-containing protein [Calditrichaeota bacterium]|nr:DUF523 domain-containing protein [Calditrichota bacterium]
MILISACLLGAKTRYDGEDNRLPHPLLLNFLARGSLIPICPEVAGGLPTPRLPAEIIGGEGKDVLAGKCPVWNCEGEDVTEEFLLGAKHTLALAKQLKIQAAILKDGSPSCGSTYIYDGTFSDRKIKGCGVTAAFLQENGIEIYHEKNFERLLSKLQD